MLKEVINNLKKLAKSEEDIMRILSDLTDTSYQKLEQSDLITILNAIKNHLTTLEVTSANRTTSLNILLEALGIESRRRAPYNEKYFFKGFLPEKIRCDADLWVLPEEKPMSDQELIDDLESGFYGREVYHRMTEGLTHIEFFRNFEEINGKNVIREQKDGKERFLKKNGIWVKRYDDKESILRGAVIWTPVDDPDTYNEYFELFKNHTNVLDVKDLKKAGK